MTPGRQTPRPTCCWYALTLWFIGKNNEPEATDAELAYPTRCGDRP